MQLLCSIPCVETRRPQIQQMSPLGQFVCSNMMTVFSCSFDEPNQALAVLWNIPGRSNINITSETGHSVDSTKMQLGEVSLTVNFDNLYIFYGCTVLYNGSRRLESSSNVATQNGKCSIVLYICAYYVSPVIHF